MANQENSEHDIEIHSLVSDLRESHEKVEENFQIMEKIFEETCRTDLDVELVKASIEKLIEDRQELRKLMEKNAVAVFLHLKNKATSSRLEFLKECREKFKNLDLGNQETKSGCYSGDQEKGECSNSSGYVTDDEIEQKDRIFLLDYSDTSSVGDKEVWNDKNVDPYMKRRFLEKAKTSSLSSYEAESEIEELIDDFDNEGCSSNATELCKQKHLYIAGASGEESSGNVTKDSGNDADVEYSGDDGHVLSNIEGLVENLKKQDEGEK